MVAGMEEFIAEVVEGKDIARPHSFERYQLEGLRLRNGVEILLMSSDDIDMATCCIGVNVGALMDPVEYQGTAHFCEHMLFMGNDKYPDEAEYDKYINSGGGFNNAATWGQRTLYYACIKPELLDGLIDRLSQFFLTPHFKADAVDREVEAVNSEFERHVGNDNRRALSLFTRLCNPSHPLFKFFTGNNTTLRRKDLYGDDSDIALTRLRENLIQFHSKYYSAHHTFAFVAGKQSLEQLREMIVPRLAQFQTVACNVERGAARCRNTPLWVSDQRLILFTPLAAERRRMDIFFTIPDQYDHWKSKPAEVIAHVLGYEGTGSVLSYLKRNGWATALRAGCEERDLGCSLFLVSIDCTEEGLKDSNIQQMGSAVFSMIRLLQETKIPDWLLNELQKLHQLSFAFEEVPPPTSLAAVIGPRLHDYGIRDVFAGDTIIYHHDKEATMACLEQMIPQKVVIMLQGRIYEDECGSVESIYGSKYTTKKIPEEWLKKWDEVLKCDPVTYKGELERANISFLKPNVYIPTNVSILAGGRQLDDDPNRLTVKNAVCYHKQDGFFNMPTVSMQCLWKTPFIFPTVSEMTQYLAGSTSLTSSGIGNNYGGFEWYKRLILATFMIESVEENLKEDTYDAEVVETKFSGILRRSVAQHNGICLSITGYSDTTPRIIEKFVAKYKHFDIEDCDVDVVYPAQVKVFASIVETSEAWVWALSRCWEALSPTEWSFDEFYDCLRNWSLEDLREILKDEAFTNRLQTGGTFDIMIQGNVEEKTARQQYVEPLVSLTLSGSDSNPEEYVSPCVLDMRKAKDVILQSGECTPLNLKMPPQDSPICFIYQGKTANQESPDNVCRLLIQFPGTMLEDDVAIHVLKNWLGTRFYDDLRTKQALGYICSMGSIFDSPKHGIHMVAQSTRPPLYLLSRMEAFVRAHLIDEESGKFRLTLSSSDFELARDAVIALLTPKPKSMQEAQSRYAREVFNHRYDFKRRNKMIEILENYSLEKFSDSIKEAFFHTPWFAVCLESTAAPFPEPEQSQALTSSSTVTYYRLKDKKSMIRAVWKEENRKAFFTTF